MISHDPWIVCHERNISQKQRICICLYMYPFVAKCCKFPTAPVSSTSSVATLKEDQLNSGDLESLKSVAVCGSTEYWNHVGHARAARTLFDCYLDIHGPIAIFPIALPLPPQDGKLTASDHVWTRALIYLQAAPFADPPVNVNNDSNYAAHVVQTHICPQFHPSNKFWPAFFTNLHASLTAQFMLHDVWCSRILRKTSRFKHNWSKSSHRMLLVPLCLFLLLFCSWQILLQSQTKCSLETWTIPEGSKGVWLLRNLYRRGCFCSWFFTLQVARCGKREICKQAQEKLHRGRVGVCHIHRHHPSHHFLQWRDAKETLAPQAHAGRFLFLFLNLHII